MALRSRSWVTQLGLWTLAAGLAISSAAVAQENSGERGEGRGASNVAQTIAPPDSTTEGSVTLGGQAVAYKAVAGTITVGATDEQDATLAPDGSLLPDSGVKPATDPAQAPPTARMFYVAYFKNDESDVTHRPVMFIYNGGPGSATMWLHMGTFGPKRIVTAGYGTSGRCAIHDREQPVFACWTRAIWCLSTRRERDSAGLREGSGRRPSRESTEMGRRSTISSVSS